MFIHKKRSCKKDASLAYLALFLLFFFLFAMICSDAISREIPSSDEIDEREEDDFDLADDEQEETDPAFLKRLADVLPESFSKALRGRRTKHMNEN